jgi:hypothetical protein
MSQSYCFHFEAVELSSVVTHGPSAGSQMRDVSDLEVNSILICYVQLITRHFLQAERQRVGQEPE